MLRRTKDPIDDSPSCPRIEVSLLPNEFEHDSDNGVAKRRVHNLKESSANSMSEEDTIHNSGGTEDHLNKSERSDIDSMQKSMVARRQPIDLSILSTKGKSFESKSSYSSHGVPCWRLGTGESLSDFTLQVVNEKTDEAINYHVHKHMLAVGPRKSEYLEDVFRTESSSAFQIVIDEKSSAFLPTLLDFIYCHDYSIDVNTENAMPLRQLGKIFKVVPLLVKVAGFILEDMKPSNLSTYVSDATFFKDEKVKELIVHRCSENIETIDVEDPMWTDMEPELFRKVLSSPLTERFTVSPYLSILVKEFVTLHQYEIDLNMFLGLTDESMFPTVDREAALPLIELCEAYDSTECEPLQQRCAHTIAGFWKTTPHEDRHRLFALLRNLPSSFTVDFLEIVDSGRAKDMTDVLGSTATNTSDKLSAEIIEPPSLTIGDLCDEFAGEDGYSTSGRGEDTLTWRLDPLLSFSDWTIKVVHLNHKRGDVYHIHKQLVALGPYRSEFLSRLFLSNDSSRAMGRGTTTIELDHKAALTFPQVLDFIYSPSHKLQVHHENAIVLRFLGRVLGMSILSKKVLEFIGKDMSLNNVMGYIEGAYAFEDERILVIASILCASEIQKIDIDSPFLEQFKPDFFAKIVSSSHIKENAKCHVTILITKYFALHNLDEVLLGELLKYVDVPRIDPLSALKLLNILSRFERAQEIETFDNLQRRCANILTENWNDLRDNHRDAVFGLFPLLNSNLLTEVFDVIDRQYMVQHYESMSLQSRLVKRYRAQVAEANHLREQEVSLLRKELEKRTSEMQTMQQTFENRLGKVDDALNRRTGRSAATAFHVPTSPMRAGRVTNHHESKIPTLRTRTPSTLSSERMRSAREAARKELNSATPCCPLSPMEARDDETPPAIPDPTDDEVVSNAVSKKSGSTSSHKSALAIETRKVKEEQKKRAAAKAAESQSLPGALHAEDDQHSKEGSFFTFPWSPKSAAENAESAE
ncbi:MAG: hypothetical protein SGARI_000075 [Bacillariaceae sp.]